MAELVVVLSTRSNIPQSHTTLLGMYFTLSVAGDNSFWICHAHEFNGATTRGSRGVVRAMFLRSRDGDESLN